MGSNYTRVTKVLVTNVTAANTGTSISTIVDGDVILFDRGFNEVGATGELLTTDPNNAVLYVGLGVAAGGMETSAPIQVKNIRNRVHRQQYQAPVPMSVAIGAINAVDKTEYIVRVIYRSEHNVTPGRNPQKSYTFTSGVGATAQQIAQGLADKIAADKSAMVTATAAGGVLTVTAKEIPSNAVDYAQRVTFDVATPFGFSDAVTNTVTPGTPGLGVGVKVKELEQTSKSSQRILWPIPSETTLATPSGKYNLITIEHNDHHIGDFQGTYSAPLRTVVAFATTDGTPSAKETAFLSKLTGVVESTGDTFVS